MWYENYPWHVKIRDGWKEFAAASKFVKGDRIIFNIVNINFNNEIKVMKESYLFEEDAGAFLVKEVCLLFFILFFIFFIFYNIIMVCNGQVPKTYN